MLETEERWMRINRNNQQGDCVGTNEGSKTSRLQCTCFHFPTVIEQCREYLQGTASLHEMRVFFCFMSVLDVYEVYAIEGLLVCPNIRKTI
jgi:hypothetical protein